MNTSFWVLCNNKVIHYFLENERYEMSFFPLYQFSKSIKILRGAWK